MRRVSDADQREPAEIDNQGADLLCANHLVQPLRDRVDGLERRGGLGGVEQTAKIKLGRWLQFYVVARTTAAAYARAACPMQTDPLRRGCN